MHVLMGLIAVVSHVIVGFCLARSRDFDAVSLCLSACELVAFDGMHGVHYFGVGGSGNSELYNIILRNEKVM